MIYSYLTCFLRSLTWQRLKNAFLTIIALYLSAILRKPVVWGLPLVMTIEPTNHCNLHCPQCHTGANKSVRPRGYMDIEGFKKILLECKNHLMYLLLFDQGEPLLHPLFCKMVQMAKNCRIYVVCSTNGQLLHDRHLADELVQSGLDELIVSIDGLTPATYNYYRQGGDLEKVLKGLQALQAARKAKGKKNPLIAIQFIVMRHNETELPFLKTVARRWGADRIYVKSAYVSSLADAQKYLPQNEKYRRYQVKDGHLQRKGHATGLCKRCWYSAVIHWNGAIVPCCFDRDDHYIVGTLREPFAVIWKSEAYQKFRSSFFYERSNICGNCTDGIKIYFS